MMTATQLFLRFLKDTCTAKEYLFFKRIILNNNGNKYFRKRPLFKHDFVEGYLSRNNRNLSNFMTRLFILAPNLIELRRDNPRWSSIKQEWKNRSERPFNGYRGRGLYHDYYRKTWRKWLKENIEKGEKSIYSPFKKGEKYEFKLKDRN